MTGYYTIPDTIHVSRDIDFFFGNKDIHIYSVLYISLNQWDFMDFTGLTMIPPFTLTWTHDDIVHAATGSGQLEGIASAYRGAPVCERQVGL